VAVTIASTHTAYPHRDDQAELALVARINDQDDITVKAIKNQHQNYQTVVTNSTASQHQMHRNNPKQTKK